MFRFWPHHWDDLPEELPVDVRPCSNGEYLPEEPTDQQTAIMALQEEECERLRRRFRMSRRDFVRTAAAYSVGFWAINQVTGTRWGSYALAHNSKTSAACDLEWPGAQMNNLPGEFIFDIQSHHVDPDGTWRVTNPVLMAFFAGMWSQAGGLPGASGDPYWPTQTPFRGGREADPIENLSRYHYLKELFLDSSTNVTVLSAVPADPSNQPLPVDEAALTVDAVRELAGGTSRCVMHAFVMPNRGSLGATHPRVGRDPLYMREELERMREHRERHGDKLRGWKVYTPWGDLPNASGWFLDDDVGLQFCDQVSRVGERYGMPKLIAAHKGFALPGFDQRAASCRDVGPVARQFPDVRFLIYHSGFDSEPQLPYPGDRHVNSAARGVDTLIKSLRENGWDATRFVPKGLAHGNSPNVYAELGSVWRSVMRDPNQAAHLLGKLITYVGPRRICWGTDSLWYGSPQSEIVALRAFAFSERAKELYNLPFGLDGDAWDPRLSALAAGSYRSAHPRLSRWPSDGKPHPERSIRNRIFGRTAAKVYRVDAEARLAAIACDAVQDTRRTYLMDEGKPTNRAPLSTNLLYGQRTRRAVLRDLVTRPWSP